MLLDFLGISQLVKSELPEFYKSEILQKDTIITHFNEIYALLSQLNPVIKWCIQNVKRKKILKRTSLFKLALYRKWYVRKFRRHRLHKRRYRYNFIRRFRHKVRKTSKVDMQNRKKRSKFKRRWKFRSRMISHKKKDFGFIRNKASYKLFVLHDILLFTKQVNILTNLVQNADILHTEKKEDSPYASLYYAFRLTDQSINVDYNNLLLGTYEIKRYAR